MIILSQIEYAIIFIISILVMLKFIQTKDGMLRILMIWYFACVAWSYGVEWGYYALWDLGYLQDFNVVLLHIICHLPKAIAMIWLYWYLKK